ncbi:hypothetical protein IFM12275_13260 [Nocardia sputorum]|nr:hypothetical protein IFM12275_13260 [Nocardia sputorum]
MKRSLERAPSEPTVEQETRYRVGQQRSSPVNCPQLSYPLVLEDCYSNRIVGYSINDRMTAALAVSVLRSAVALRVPAGTIVHSDRSSQFR